MRNINLKANNRGRAGDPSTVTCPNCGHSLDLLCKSTKSGALPAFLRKQSRGARPLLAVLRGSLLWFAIVLIVLGIIAGAAGQNNLTTFVGLGLLAVYGFTYFVAARFTPRHR